MIINTTQMRMALTHVTAMSEHESGCRALGLADVKASYTGFRETGVSAAVSFKALQWDMIQKAEAAELCNKFVVISSRGVNGSQRSPPPFWRPDFSLFST